MMRFYLTFFLILFLALPTLGQKLDLLPLIQDDISIRAISIDKNKIYYTGSNSKFGYVEIRNNKIQKQVKLSTENLQFRTLAQNKHHFFTINIESPAYFFKINKKTLTYEIIHIDSSSTAFYDSLIYHEGSFFALSDPSENNKLKLLQFYMFDGNFNKKNVGNFSLKEGEAAFAASNTNLSVYRNWIWIATGGKLSRVLKINLKTNEVESPKIDFIQGQSSEGIYSIDFYKNKFGIAVGGDYTNQSANIKNIATTLDGGKSWQIQASGKNGGYKTCVKIRPGSKGKDIIAVGDQQIELSQDYGKTWKIISLEKNVYTCEWLNKKEIIFAGKNKIILGRLID